MEVKVKAGRKTETEKLFSDLDKPSLHALSYVLRHPDTWPKGFIWDYKSCSHCAMGLAHELWGIAETTPTTGASIMAQEFGMPFTAAKAIFIGRGKGDGPADWRYHSEQGWFGREKKVEITYDSVTPEMVADQIDKYLQTVE